ncbi:DMT family transporter [Niabella sp. 22666]|uniref:DMT family transporter n=1 Tax=Niabella sp. 22666 TaxID=3453954 RepID=UPI003F82E25D
MQKKLYFTLLVIGTAFWGISFVFVKEGISNNSPFIFLFYKFLIAAVVLAVVFYKELPLLSRQIAKTGALAGLSLLAGTICQTIGLQYTTVSNSAFITGLDVLLIPILKLVVYKKSVQPRVWIACIIAFTGLYIIAAKNGIHLNVGDIWTAVGALGFAFYVLQTGRHAHLPHPMLRVIVVMFTCALGCLVAGLWGTNNIWLPSGFHFWKGALFAAIPATAYMYGVQNISQRYLDEEKIALAYLCEPIFATIAGVLLINEVITIHTYVGGSLIIAGIIISEINWKILRKRSTSPDAEVKMQWPTLFQDPDK